MVLTTLGRGGGVPQKPWFTQAPFPTRSNSHSTCPLRWLSARLLRHFMTPLRSSGCLGVSLGASRCLWVRPGGSGSLVVSLGLSGILCMSLGLWVSLGVYESLRVSWVWEILSVVNGDGQMEHSRCLGGFCTPAGGRTIKG